MTKRGFIKAVMSTVATVALAPEIAFGVSLKSKINPLWFDAPEYWVFAATRQLKNGGRSTLVSCSPDGLARLIKVTGVPLQEWEIRINGPYGRKSIDNGESEV